MICCRPGGLRKGTFVEEYLGEAYSPWRWFERQDAVKKCNPDGTLPDFYNIQIERPKDDDLGYGVIFVEVMVSVKGLCEMGGSGSASWELCIAFVSFLCTELPDSVAVCRRTRHQCHVYIAAHCRRRRVDVGLYVCDGE